MNARVTDLLKNGLAVHPGALRCSPETAGWAMFEDDELDSVFELLKRIAHATVSTVGPHVEAVVHDLRDPEHALVGIAGNLTGRKVGASIPDSEYLPDNINRHTHDLLNHPLKTSSGKKLLSTEVFLRNRNNEIVGAFGLNIDKEGMRKARDILNELLREEEEDSTAEVIESFATDPADFINIALRSAEKEVGKPIHSLKSADKAAVVAILDRMGVFRFRQSADLVAEALLLSRASVYSHLKKSRTK
jgi:predicted transcriptional regulator YheO